MVAPDADNGTLLPVAVGSIKLIIKLETLIAGIWFQPLPAFADVHVHTGILPLDLGGKIPPGADVALIIHAVEHGPGGQVKTRPGRPEFGFADDGGGLGHQVVQGGVVAAEDRQPGPGAGIAGQEIALVVGVREKQVVDQVEIGADIVVIAFQAQAVALPDGPAPAGKVIDPLVIGLDIETLHQFAGQIQILPGAQDAPQTVDRILTGGKLAVNALVR